MSSPMCMRISSPSSLRTVTACAEGWTSITSPATGEIRMLPNGSMEIPSPTILRANTGSGTWSSGTSTPVSGASSVTTVGF